MKKVVLLDQNRIDVVDVLKDKYMKVFSKKDRDLLEVINEKLDILFDFLNILADSVRKE